MVAAPSSTRLAKLNNTFLPKDEDLKLHINMAFLHRMKTDRCRP
jgi:hypothetical protein